MDAKAMSKIYVVATKVSGYCREDSDNASVVGAYLDSDVAEAVRKVSGHGAIVKEVELDFIPAGLLGAMDAFGIKIKKLQVDQ